MANRHAQSNQNKHLETMHVPVSEGKRSPTGRSSTGTTKATNSFPLSRAQEIRDSMTEGEVDLNLQRGKSNFLHPISGCQNRSLSPRLQIISTAGS